METTRELALKALHEIWEKGSKPKDALERRAESLEKRDRAFLMELVYGVVRYRDTLDWALQGFLKKPSGLARTTLDNLRLGSYQLLFMRVAGWAAVNEAVELEKKGGHPQLVNAVLRNLLRNLDFMKERLRAMGDDRTAPHIATVTSHPRWLIKRWMERFGEDEAAALARANNRIPPLILRLNTLRTTREEAIRRLSEIGIRGEPTPYSPDGVRLREFHPFEELAPVRDLFLVQDEAAQLISYLLGPQPGERVLDACAAPGGKTTHMAQLMKDQGEIIAVDSDEKRLGLLRKNVHALSFRSVEAVQADISDYCPGIPFDRILLDAPCSSLGVIRRNPDVKYRHKPQDLLRFRANQLRLLRTLSKLLKPGGTMVYSVCSTEPEEGEEVIKEFLKDSGDFYIIDTSFPFLKGFRQDGFFRTYPHRHDMDGFFGARLCRKA